MGRRLGRVPGYVWALSGAWLWLWGTTVFLAFAVFKLLGYQL